MPGYYSDKNIAGVYDGKNSIGGPAKYLCFKLSKVIS